MYQKIIIMGNLGNDPEMRYTPQGKPVTNFSVATNRKWTNADGTPGEETIWFRVSAWGKLAEVCDEYLSKGRRVLIEGRLRPDPETSRLAFFSGFDIPRVFRYTVKQSENEGMIHQPPGMGARPAENEQPWASAEAAPGFSGGGSHACPEPSLS